MYINLVKVNLFNKIKRITWNFTRNINGLNLWNEELTPEIKLQIEKHWSNKLPIQKYDENNKNKEKYYVLSMFPYPSGNLHMGHVRVYTISDSVARFQRMNNKNVIHPIGWDAFGLPAENAAIERNVPPDEWTNQNIQHMKEQLKNLGCSFDWDCEISTCDPRYYKWTQELFLKLYDSGLIYQKEAIVNWDPIDKTVLADEQVDENGCSWRSGCKVEKRLLRQWFVRTTKFAKALLDGLDDSILHDWRDIIKLQRHWIGECDGINFDFKIKNSEDIFSVWSDKQEFAHKAAFLAVSKDHPLANNECKEIDKSTSILTTSLINPFNCCDLPIFVTDLIEYKEFTDTHLGIPCVNIEDRDFALKYDISFDSDDSQQDNIKKAQEGNFGGYLKSAKLRDWLISRQRYWGTPIPIIHCKSCGAQPVPRQNLPVQLPKSKTELNSTKVFCPNCGGTGKRETDTMDTFVDSSWYFLRYLSRDFETDMFDSKKAFNMTPVDLYIGGKEHAVLHLYYARFVSHFLHSLGLLPEREPFKRLLVQGMVMGRSYRLKGTGQYLQEQEVDIVDLKRNKATHKTTGEPVVVQWEKMSKSKYNGVDPSEMFATYSVDTTRLLILADVSPTSNRNWNSNTFPGLINWQRRLWLTLRDFLNHRNAIPPINNEDEYTKQNDYMFDSRNYYIKGVTFNYSESQQISVAISKLQGLTNSLRKVTPPVIARSLQFERALACQIILLAPMAPHFASELWAGFTSAPNHLNETGEIKWNESVLLQEWPKIDDDYKMDLVCTVNGEECCIVKIPRIEIERLSKEQAIEIILKEDKVQDILKTSNVIDMNYVWCKDYEGVVNIRVKQSYKAKVKSGQLS